VELYGESENFFDPSCSFGLIKFVVDVSGWGVEEIKIELECTFLIIRTLMNGMYLIFKRYNLNIFYEFNIPQNR